MIKKILIVGGGASGMLAAIFASEKENQVILLEKNDKLGKKLFITGKGRCNITNACEKEELLQHVISNPKFLYSAFYQFDSDKVIKFFQSIGLKTKIERGERVFPVSDKSSDVIGVLTQELKRKKVDIRYHSEVEELLVKDNKFCGLKLKGENSFLYGDIVIIATGGLSYPSTGSTGDGYQFAKEMGHTITTLSPSLVPIIIKEDFVPQLQGLTLKNVSLIVYKDKKEIFHEFGEMLFTHFGVSGPLVLSASSYIIPYLSSKELRIKIDCKPALSNEQLDQRILRDFQEYQNKQFKNSLEQLLPRKLIPVIISLCEINPEKKVNQITKEERNRLVCTIKGINLSVDKLRGYEEAVITKGGVSVKEINPTTMESKLVQNVFFVGEVLDVDALTGGFNLQIAWSTAYIAAKAITDK